MYHKWINPTQNDYFAILNDIKAKHNIEPENLAKFFQLKLGMSKATSYRYISLQFDVSKLKFSFWVFLNILAGRDLKDIFPVIERDLVEWEGEKIDLDNVRSLIGENGFKSLENGFSVDCDLSLLFYNDSVNNKNSDRAFTCLTRRNFTNSISVNYTVFLRKLQKGDFSYIEFKLYLLTIGYSVDEIFN